jgi:enoyl-CoA hydratase
MDGLILATCCDIIIAAENAKFADHSVRMACPSVEYMPFTWNIGGRITKELLFYLQFHGCPYGALRCGLVNRVVPNDRLEEETLELTQRIARHDPFLLKLAKKMVNDQLDLIGQRQVLNLAFYLHQLAHIHWAQVSHMVKFPDEKKRSAIIYRKEMRDLVS